MNIRRHLLLWSLLMTIYDVRGAYDSSGYVEVRPGAHMFWWLMRAGNGLDKHHTDYPLVIWLAGGPGASASEDANFGLIGPLTPKLVARNSTWLTYANLLFIDSPVGTGYSYVDDGAAFATNISTMTTDLMKVMEDLMQRFPDIHEMRTIIWSESYGGKVAVNLAEELFLANAHNRMRIKLHAIGLASPALDTVTTTAFYSSYAHTLSLIDQRQKDQIDVVASQIPHVMKGKTSCPEATHLWIQVVNMMQEFAYGMDWYNVLRPHEPDKTSRYEQLLWSTIESDDEIRSIPIFEAPCVPNIMNGHVKAKLNIPEHVVHGSQRISVFDHLMGDFMFPVTESLDFLLNETSIPVVVITGQLDLSIPAIGIEAVIDKLSWHSIDKFRESPRKLFSGSIGATKAYVKTYDNLSLIWVMNAGHGAATEKPGLCLKILKQISRPQK